MPYSTTTSITAGSVLDAIPASAGTPQDDQPQTSFDALLRPPAPSVCAPPPADDHSPDTLPRAEELEHDEESSPDQPQENSSSAPSSQSAALLASALASAPDLSTAAGKEFAAADASAAAADSATTSSSSWASRLWTKCSPSSKKCFHPPSLTF